MTGYRVLRGGRPEEVECKCGSRSLFDDGVIRAGWHEFQCRACMEQFAVRDERLDLCPETYFHPDGQPGYCTLRRGHAGPCA